MCEKLRNKSRNANTHYIAGRTLLNPLPHCDDRKEKQRLRQSICAEACRRIHLPSESAKTSTKLPIAQNALETRCSENAGFVDLKNWN